MKFNLFLFFNAFISLTLISSINNLGHTKEEWKSRTIYQLLTDRFAKTKDDDPTLCANFGVTCGGTFKGIINHLDYIAGMGFGAIWISPPLKNKANSYHGYHNIDLNTINPLFGTEQDLKNLVAKCHERDIWVILDIVPNHMADGTDYVDLLPFNDPKYYHDYTDAYCDGHWDEQHYKENCRIWGLPDLKQEDEFVNKTLIEWLHNMINKYSFDGIRYADVPNVPTWFWNNLTYNVSNMYTIGIFDTQDVNYLASYQNYMDGVADFPLLYQLRSSFCDGSMISLNNYIQSSQSIYKEPQYNGIWFDNHDKERFYYECPRGQKPKALRNLIVFTFFFKGIPIFYYGDEQYFEQGGENDKRRQPLFDNYDEDSDIYQMIKTIHDIRKLYKTYDHDFVVKYVDVDNYVFTRGENVMIAVNRGLHKVIEITDHGFKKNDKFCNKLKKGDCIEINDDNLIIRMEGEPKIYIKKSAGKIIYISGYLLAFLILLVLF